MNNKSPIEYLCNLWPNWTASREVLEEWKKIFQCFDDDVCFDSIEQLWKNGTYQHQPSSKHFLDIARSRQTIRRNEKPDVPNIVYAPIYIVCISRGRLSRVGSYYPVRYTNKLPSKEKMLNEAGDYAEFLHQHRGGHWVVWECETKEELEERIDELRRQMQSPVLTDKKIKASSIISPLSIKPDVQDIVEEAAGPQEVDWDALEAEAKAQEQAELNKLEGEQ